MFLLCVGTKLLVLQTPPPTIVLVLEEVGHFGEQALQPLPLLLLALQGLCQGRPECLCFEHHFGVHVQQQPPAGEQGNTQGGEQKGMEDLHGRGCLSFVCWSAAQQQAQGGGNTATGGVGKRVEKVRLMSCFMHRGLWGCFKWLIHRNTLLFKMKFTGATRNSNCFAKGCRFLFFEQGLRHAFAFFLYFFLLPAWDLLLYLFISKMSLWDPSVLTEAVNQHLLLSQHCCSKGLVGYGWNISHLYSHGAL